MKKNLQGQHICEMCIFEAFETNENLDTLLFAVKASDYEWAVKTIDIIVDAYGRLLFSYLNKGTIVPDEVLIKETKQLLFGE